MGELIPAQCGQTPEQFSDKRIKRFKYSHLPAMLKKCAGLRVQRYARSVVLLQPHSDFEPNLPMCDLAVLNVAADFRDFKPI